MRTISQEMPAAERRERLMKGLMATTEDKVVVNFSHLAHAIGMEAAERMVDSLATMDSLIRSPYSRKPHLVVEALCEIDRMEAIEAIQRADIKTAKAAINAKLRS